VVNRAAQPSVEVGETLADKYAVESTLGVGQMGTVVAATHLELGGLHGLKLLPRPPAAQPNCDPPYTWDGNEKRLNPECI
jgi:hypothetical protein